MIQFGNILLRDMIAQVEQENVPHDAIIRIIRRIHTPSARIYGYVPDEMYEVGDNNTFDEILAKYGEKICYLQVVNFITDRNDLTDYSHLGGHECAEMESKSKVIDSLAKYTNIKHIILTGTELRVDDREFLKHHLENGHVNMDIKVRNNDTGVTISGMTKHYGDPSTTAIMMDDINDAMNIRYSKLNEDGMGFSRKPTDSMSHWAYREGFMLVGVENVVVPRNYEVPNICKAMIRK